MSHTWDSLKPVIIKGLTNKRIMYACFKGSILFFSQDSLVLLILSIDLLSNSDLKGKLWDKKIVFQEIHTECNKSDKLDHVKIKG